MARKQRSQRRAASMGMSLRRVAPCCIVMLGLLTSTGAALPATARIVYSSADDMRALNRELFATDGIGAETHHLTDSPATDAYPRWSPDGQRILFLSTRGGPTDLYVMNASNGRIRQLTSDDAKEYPADWAPNGRHIAFAATRGGSSNIFVMEIDGRAERQVTDSPGVKYSVAWVPDGLSILFSADVPDVMGRQIWKVGAEGLRPPRRITDAPGSQMQPAWSPGGRQIAWVSASQEEHLYVADHEGANARRVTRVGGLYLHPVWISGEEIAVLHSRGEEGPGIYTLEADGTRGLRHEIPLHPTTASFDVTFEPLPVAPRRAFATSLGRIKGSALSEARRR